MPQMVSIALQIMIMLALPLLCEANISWTFSKPTTRTDGSLLASGDIKGYEVYLNGLLQVNLLPGNFESIEFLSLDNGNYCLTLKTVDIDNNKSVLSNASCKDETGGTTLVLPYPPIVIE